MPFAKLTDLVEDIEAEHVAGNEALIHLEYRGSAHVLGADLQVHRVLSCKHEFRVPLVEIPNLDMDHAVSLITAVARTRPVKLSVAQYVDIDIRDALRHADGRGSWTISARFLADPLVLGHLPRWMEATPVDVPEGWVIGISTVDRRKPIVCVRHENRIGLLARDPMIAAARV